MLSIAVAIDAKFNHTNLALRSIGAYTGQAGITPPQLMEFTINQRPGYILRCLYNQKADIYLFSAYLWNIAFIEEIGAELRKLLPHAVLAAGGPEVTYRGKAFLLANPAFDLVLTGEGEATACEVLGRLEAGASLEGCHGTVVRRGDGAVIAAPARPPLPLDALPFPYGDLSDLSNRTLYYESSRGCPFSCAYCLSSVETGVRLRPLHKVFADLSRFLLFRVPQVKFVDRTFNCNRPHALAIWKFLKENDNGVTNFHFELAAHLLNEEDISFLATVRPGLFQFEIGVQSTNEETLEAISRTGSLEQLFTRVRQLAGSGNIHLHLDLIAGLPFEDYESFARSFNQVYRLRPNQFQLGFLKILNGSAMERQAEGWGMVCQSRAPYQVLQTRWLTFDQVQELEGIAEMVELFYNSGRFSNLIGHLCARFPSPFLFYQALWRYWQQTGRHKAPVSKLGHYDFLGEFLRRRCGGTGNRAKWLCKLDLLLHERPRGLPAWVDVDLTRERRQEVLDFLARPDILATWLPRFTGQDPKQISRLVHMELFPFHPLTRQETPCWTLFDYDKRDFEGHARTLFFTDI